MLSFTENLFLLLLGGGVFFLILAGLAALAAVCEKTWPGQDLPWWKK